MSPSSAFTARDCGHVLLGVVAPSTSLPGHSLVATATHATIGGCRLDLVVTLYSRDTFDLHTTVDDVYTGFQLVSNARHIAVGTSVTSAVPTSVLDPQDTFQYCAFYADEPPSTCRADTTVDTPMPQVAAAAATYLVSVNGTVVATASASGQGRQMLWMNVSG